MTSAGPDVVLVLPHLGPGGSQRVATTLLNAWQRGGRRATLVTLLNDPADAHHLEAGIQRVRLEDVLRARRSPSPAHVGRAVHRSLPRLAARTFDLLGLDVRARVARMLGPLLAPERYLALFYPESLREVRGLRRLLRETRPRVVVGFLGSTNVTAVLAARPLGLPVVISERNDPAVETLDAPWQHLRERTYRWATLVTANSHGALDTMQAFVPASKLAYVPNPVAIPQPGAVPAAGRSSATAPVPAIRRVAASRDPVVLGAGRLDPQKGFDILLRAFAKAARDMAGWRVEILGDGPLRTELARLAERLDVRDRVVLCGHVDDPAPHYARAAVFALPSRYEGMPNVLLEAMAAGLPVIVSDASPGPLETVTDGEEGIVIPAGDVTALAEAMTRLARDAEMRLVMGGAGRSRSAAHGLQETLGVWDAVMEQAQRLHAGGPADASSR